MATKKKPKQTIGEYKNRLDSPMNIVVTKKAKGTRKTSKKK